ncbi:MAG: glycosyltransferase [Chloroflexi bacterium]|nr:glycosyltransferase [Chloroflexota bacterium]
MARVLIVSSHMVDVRMAGSGIRCWEIACALSRHADVTLATPRATMLADPQIQLVAYDGRGTVIRECLASADVVLVQGYVLQTFPFLKNVSQPLVVDLYDPFLFENFEAHRFRRAAHRQVIHARDLVVVLEQLRRGDFFVCSNERQRDYWLGMLAAAGRIGHCDGREVGLRDLVDVVPFGLPEISPSHTRQVLKGVVPGIGEGDRVIVWGGGIWAWLDPLVLVRAMTTVAAAYPEARLFFMGKEHPDPSLASSNLSLYSQAVDLARKLGLLGRSVFFNDRWVEYDERQNYLLEADIGVSCHQRSIETRYAQRTRLLDYVWCELPIVTSSGDTWSEFVEAHGLGKVAPVGDADALAAALNSMLDEPDLKAAHRPRFRAIRSLLTWERAIYPLVRFIASDR